jgi:hypothetical protein
MKPASILGLFLIILGGLAVAYEGTFTAELAHQRQAHFSSVAVAGAQSPFGFHPALTMSGLLGGLVLVIAGHRREGPL